MNTGHRGAECRVGETCSHVYMHTSQGNIALSQQHRGNISSPFTLAKNGKTGKCPINGCINRSVVPDGS